MSTTLPDSLLAHVLANPGDDAARVVYGDALAQAGDARGELITSQCALAEMGIERVDDLIDADVDHAKLVRLAEASRHVNRLVARHGHPWRAVILREAELETIEFRRGFPEIFGLTAANAVDVLRRASVQTTVRVVRVSDVHSHDLAALAELELPHLRTLAIDCHERSAPELWERVLARPSLRHLVLEGRVENIEPSWFARLPELEELSIVEPEHYQLEPARRDALREALPRCFPVRAATPSRLVIDGLDDGDARRYAELAGSIRTLELRGAIRPSALAAVLEAATHVDNLVYDPADDDTTAVDAGVQVIAHSPLPLRRLRLHGVVGRSVAMLAQAPERRSLRALHFSTRGLERDDDLARSILALPQLVQLVGLSSAWRVVLGAEHPTLVDFWCSSASERDTLRELRAHFGAVIPWFTSTSGHRKFRDVHHLALPAGLKLDRLQLLAILRSVEDLIVPLRRMGTMIVVDPLLDNEGIIVKLDRDNSLIRLACLPEDLAELAQRLDQVARVLVRASGGVLVPVT